MHAAALVPMLEEHECLAPDLSHSFLAVHARLCIQDSHSDRYTVTLMVVFQGLESSLMLPN